MHFKSQQAMDDNYDIHTHFQAECITMRTTKRWMLLLCVWWWWT